MKFSKFAVLFILVGAVAFVASMWVLYDRHQSVPDSLIAAVFTFLTSEAGILGAIKCSDNKHNNNDKGDV